MKKRIKCVNINFFHINLYLEIKLYKDYKVLFYKKMMFFLKKRHFLSPKASPLDLAKSQEKSIFRHFCAPKICQKMPKKCIFARAQKSAFFTIFRDFLYFSMFSFFS